MTTPSDAELDELERILRAKEWPRDVLPDVVERKAADAIAALRARIAELAQDVSDLRHDIASYIRIDCDHLAGIDALEQRAESAEREQEAKAAEFRAGEKIADAENAAAFYVRDEQCTPRRAMERQAIALETTKARIKQLENGYDELRTICNRYQRELAAANAKVAECNDAYDELSGAYDDATKEAAALRKALLATHATLIDAVREGRWMTVADAIEHIVRPAIDNARSPQATQESGGMSKFEDTYGSSTGAIERRIAALESQLAAAKQRNEGYQASRDYAIDLLAGALRIDADKVRAIEYYAKLASDELAATTTRASIPREPTPEMERAGEQYDRNAAKIAGISRATVNGIWRTMYDAALAKPAQGHK
jgi:chromosome segregation ATPase